jgi:AcrR family transcriptional regulator
MSDYSLMTEKQEQILSAALELFANVGYNATSTNAIAQKAGVSEGLIFRHFKNKQGLLDALVREAEAKIAGLVSHIIEEDDAKAVLRKTIQLPFLVRKNEYDFWRLQFKLKWEKEYDDPKKMKPLTDKLTWAFKQQKAFEKFLLGKYGV